MNGADYWQQQQLEEQLQWFMQNTDKFNKIFGAKDECTQQAKRGENKAAKHEAE